MQTHHQAVTTQQTALAAAIKSANDKVADITKAQPQTNVTDLPLLIVREDLLGHHVVFLANTLDREKGQLSYWDLKKGSKPTPVSTAFYRSTRPVKDRDLVNKIVEQYSKEFGAKSVILRERLIKEGTAPRAEDGSISANDLNDYKLKLKAAFVKALDKALEEM